MSESVIDCTMLVGWEGFFPRLVGDEDLFRFCWNERALVTTMDLSWHVPVADGDGCLSWEMGKGHVVEDDSIVNSGSKFSEVVDMRTEEGIVELRVGPFSLPKA